MSTQFNLLTEGKIPNYPNKIYADLFKVKQWRNLKVASKEGVDEVLIDCLDQVVDFPRTGIIKSVRELTPMDIKYLFFQQRVQCIGAEVNVDYTCNSCAVEGEEPKHTPSKIDMAKSIKEIYLKDKIKEDSFGSIKFRVPTFTDMKDYQEKLTRYLETIKDDGDPDFSESDLEMLAYYIYIKEPNMENFAEFKEFILDQEGTFLKAVGAFIGKTYHGFETITSVKCRHCNKVGEVTVPLDVGFFLE